MQVERKFMLEASMSRTSFLLMTIPTESLKCFKVHP